MTDILHAFHDGPCRGHFSNKSMAYKVLHSGYYCPIIFKDAAKYAKGCIVSIEWVDLRHLIRCPYNPKS